MSFSSFYFTDFILFYFFYILPNYLGQPLLQRNLRRKKKIKTLLIFQGESRQLSFPADYEFGNRRLMKHVIETIKVVDFDLCELQCYLEANCVSINFNVIPDSEGRHECELNNATHRSDDNELMNKEGYVYKGAEVRHLNLLLSFAEKKS